MPESESVTFGSDLDEVATVEAFYRAVGSRDAVSVARIVEARFAPDASITWPDSLPYGGTLSGAPVIAKVLSRAATASGVGGPANVQLLEVIGDGQRIAARVAFDWSASGDSPSISTEAVELWSFTDGTVTAIHAFYWDTHRCLASASSPL